MAHVLYCCPAQRLFEGSLLHDTSQLVKQAPQRHLIAYADAATPALIPLVLIISAIHLRLSHTREFLHRHLLAVSLQRGVAHLKR